MIRLHDDGTVQWIQETVHASLLHVPLPTHAKKNFSPTVQGSSCVALVFSFQPLAFSISVPCYLSINKEIQILHFVPRKSDNTYRFLPNQISLELPFLLPSQRPIPIPIAGAPPSPSSAPSLPSLSPSLAPLLPIPINVAGAPPFPSSARRAAISGRLVSWVALLQRLISCFFFLLGLLFQIEFFRSVFC